MCGPGTLNGYSVVATTSAADPDGFLPQRRLIRRDDGTRSPGAKDVICRAGEPSPPAPEEQLLSHPAIFLGRAVVGLPDQYLGKNLRCSRFR